eukprot:747805-Karenia_brevis.AAC.1
MNEIPVRKLKAFLDVGEEETLTRERWGASKFVKNQLRIITDNTYDPDAEPDLAPRLPDDLSAHALIPVHMLYDIWA